MRPKNIGTRVWFLYSIHYVNSKICVCTISHEEIVSPWDRNRISLALSFWVTVTRCVTYVKYQVSFETFCTLSHCLANCIEILSFEEYWRLKNVPLLSVLVLFLTVPDNFRRTGYNSTCLCWKKQCYKAIWRNGRERRGACTHCGQLNEYPTLPTPSLSPPPPKKKKFFYFWFENNFFL